MHPPAASTSTSDPLNLRFCHRVLPQDQDSGGFFFAVLELTGQDATSGSSSSSSSSKGAPSRGSSGVAHSAAAKAFTKLGYNPVTQGNVGAITVAAAGCAGDAGDGSGHSLLHARDISVVALEVATSVSETLPDALVSAGRALDSGCAGRAAALVPLEVFAYMCARGALQSTQVSFDLAGDARRAPDEVRVAIDPASVAAWRNTDDGARRQAAVAAMSHGGGGCGGGGFGSGGGGSKAAEKRRKAKRKAQGGMAVAAAATAAAVVAAATAPGNGGAGGCHAVCLLDPALCSSLELTVGPTDRATSSGTDTGTSTVTGTAGPGTSALTLTSHPLICASFSEALTTLFGPLELTTDQAALAAALPDQLKGLSL